MFFFEFGHIDNGHIIALDTPAQLVKALASEHRVVFDAPPQLDLQTISALPTVSKVEQQHGHVTVFGSAENLVASIVVAFEKQGLPLNNLRTEQANLEDVFIALTGRELRA